MADAVAAAVRAVAGTEAGRRRLSIGAGGDRTAEVDRVAEEAVVAVCERLAAAGMTFLLRSEELGDRSFGADRPLLLVDPVDGSLNAMAGLPYYCTSLALLDGETLGDTVCGVVRSLSGPGMFSAVRGGGAWRDGVRLEPLRVSLGEGGRIPLVVLEAHRSFGRAADPGHAPLAALLRTAGRVRMLGSAALSLCHTATGAASVLVAPDGMRPWDCAAGLLVLHEVGAVVTDLAGASIAGVPARMGASTPVVASLDPAVHQRALSLLAEGQEGSG